MTTRRSFLYFASAGSLAALAACSSEGSTGSNSSGSANGSAGSSAAPAGSNASAAAPDASAYPVTVKDGKGELTIEALPQKVAVMDVTALDTMVALGLQDRVVGVGANGEALPKSLAEFFPKAQIVGTLHEPSAEKIDALGVDMVIVGGRSADAYESLSKSFTTLLMPGDRSSAFGDRLTSGAELLGQVFGVSAKATQELATYKSRTETVKAKGETIGTGLILMTSGGQVSVYGSGSRFGLIHDELGVAQAITDLTAETHGEKISFERIKEVNPDWLFVIDRDAAIGESGQAAKEVLNTELVTSTTAWTKDQVVYLDSERWYVIGAGLHNAPAMVDEVATAIKA